MPGHQFSRRAFLRGVGVTMALPWMESLNVWGDTPPVATSPPAKRRCAWPCYSPATDFIHKEWWAKGEGKSMELGESCAADRFPRKTAVHSRPLQRRGAKGQHSQLANGQSAFRRAAGFGWRDSLRHEHRPIAGAALRPLDQGAQPRAGLRKVESLRAQELFDALQLAYFVELADHPDATGDLSRLWPSTGFLRTR